MTRLDGIDDFLRGLRLDDEPGPAPPLTPLEEERLVQLAVDEALPSLRPDRRPTPRLLPAAAAIFALVGAPTAWAAWNGWLDPLIVPGLRLSRPFDPDPDPVLQGRKTSTASVADTRLSVPTPGPVGASVPRTPPLSSDESPAGKASTSAGKSRAWTRAGAGGPAGAARLATRLSAEWLAEASRLRRAGRWREAAELYARVRRSATEAGAAYVASVAEGQLRLEHLADPQGALRAFRQAQGLRPGGPLAKEVRQGLEAAKRRLKRPRVVAP